MVVLYTLLSGFGSDIKLDSCSPRCILSTNMNAKELCENDDLATSLILDPILGFTTHKMNTRFRPVKGRTEDMLQTVDEFLCTANYEKCFSKILSADWARIYFMSKTSRQKQVCTFNSNMTYNLI